MVAIEPTGDEGRRASKQPDKFAAVEWEPTTSGLPILHKNVLAWAECATVHDIEIGDHAVLVARVEDGAALPRPRPPLMYFRRSWGSRHRHRIPTSQSPSVLPRRSRSAPAIYAGRAPSSSCTTALHA